MKTFSPAKINLTLEILGKRPDGFHELATWMLPVGLYDSIEIEEASHPSFISNVPELGGDPSNLVLRAARSFTQAALIDTAYAIRLEKRIPIGAGLGGGSSNAAVTLQLLNKLHGFPLRAEQLEELAANLGSDWHFSWMVDLPGARGEANGSRPVSFPITSGYVYLNLGSQFPPPAPTARMLDWRRI
jgi:4-diphosphocytidyl-2-C-methyl-D-erythritol kinase